MLVSPASWASPESRAGLREAIKELNYSLTVVWDQKNPEIYAAAVDNFQSSIKSLQLSGLSRKEILKEGISGIPDSRLREQIRSAVSSINLEVLTPQEFQEKLITISKNSSNTGARWDVTDRILSGEFLIPGLIAFAVLIIAIPLLLTSGESKTPPTGDGSGTPSDSSNEPQWKCEYRDSCFGAYGAGKDDYGFSLNTGSNSCGYEYACGYFY